MNWSCLKKVIIPFSLLFFLLLPVTKAASLSLTQIGALSTGGAAYSEWWYTGTSPLLSGTAGEGATVEIMVGSDSHEVTADSSGNWSYQSSMGEGDFSISITSGGESYSFTLHSGQTMPDTITGGTSMETTESTVSVPATGYPQLLGMITATTLLGVGFYYYLYARRNTKKAYVKSILNSLR